MMVCVVDSDDDDDGYDGDGYWEYVIFFLLMTNDG